MIWFVMLVLSFISTLFLPWWTIVFAGFISGMVGFPSRSFKVFGIGFLCVIIVWLGFSLSYSVQNEFILVSRLANLFSLPHSSLIFVIQAFIGGLLGGLSCASGLGVMRIIKGR